ncbi:MAG TPA: phytase [Blastocatellia bacterium]|nr:phytase [Blastocatellia bacterium]
MAVLTNHPRLRAAIIIMVVALLVPALAFTGPLQGVENARDIQDKKSSKDKERKDKDKEEDESEEDEDEDDEEEEDDEDDDDKDEDEEGNEDKERERGGQEQSSEPKEIAKADSEMVVTAPAAGAAGEPMATVVATVETQPVPNSGDAADDPAIWVHPKDPSQSTIIGTNKQGGIAVYDLAGIKLQYLADGQMNNVDLRDGFPLGGEKVTLVTASNRSNNSIAVYRVNPATRLLENVAARTITTGPIYGVCMYRSARTGKFYSFTTGKTGDVEQWELFDNGSGKVDAKKVRQFKAKSQVEGCVADDELGHFYVGEEAVGIWKVSAEPDGAAELTLIDKAGAGGHLVADVEGLTIAYGKDGSGYLIASSQGNNSFIVYRREGDNQFVKAFRIASEGGMDGVEDTDGIDITTANLGPAFPEGVFVVQDGINDKGNQNFKLVPNQRIFGKP